MTTPILVTGAAGQLGRLVLELLLEKKAGPIIATTRKPEALAAFAARGVDVRAADFDKPEGLAAAFKGAERALLISTDALDRPGRRLEQHRVAIKALQAAGVKHLVYTSLPSAPKSAVVFAPDHAGTEQAIEATGLEFTILRNNLYIDLSLGNFAGAAASGQLIDARPTGKIAYITREDCARAAAAALISGSGKRTIDITGPEALSGDDLAAALTAVTGKKVAHLAVPLQAVIDGMVKHGLPLPIAQVFASIETSAEKGELAAVTDQVKVLTGSAPASVKEWLTANRAALGA